MVVCRWCKKTIVNVGNPQIIYSNCSDCKYTDGVNHRDLNELYQEEDDKTIWLKNGKEGRLK